MTPEQLGAWVDSYERAWRTAGVSLLRELFTEDVTYRPSPYDEVVVGLTALGVFWDVQRDGPDGVFTMSGEVVSCSADTGVVRVQVRYGEPVTQEYHDLWVVRFASDGRAAGFEEWPFWPAHGRTPQDAAAMGDRTPPLVLARSEVPGGDYGEWVRSADLSAGVYRLPTGAVDGQSPHGEDEVYVVTAGAAHLEVEGERTQVVVGSVAFVPRGADHRFVDITADLEVSVVFAPPETAPTD